MSTEVMISKTEWIRRVRECLPHSTAELVLEKMGIRPKKRHKTLKELIMQYGDSVKLRGELWSIIVSVNGVEADCDNLGSDYCADEEMPDLWCDTFLTNTTKPPKP